MTAIFKHELRNYFHTLTAYVFGAFLLAFVGIGAMLYNIQAAVSNFEFVLGFGSFIFIIIVPILTMRVIAEEKKLKTDQLLYALPITTTQVVIGKYLALLTVFLLPLCVVALYPLIFSQFGDVSLLTAYGSLGAFFLLGAALLALGMFISSLTDNQGFAAGISIAVIGLNYYSISLAEQVSSTGIGSLVSILVLVIGLYFLIRQMTGNETFAWWTSFFLGVGTIVAYVAAPGAFEGLLPRIMEKLSLFSRLDIFVNGIFDLTSVVYFLTVIGLFLFLSVQSLEKKRYN